ncbi:molybdenum cofactor biosynthesis protein MoaE [Sphingosinicella sp. CPCC 101087]|uniref:molybdenum cofactor biosynthesis protein MoaE n=1 Tax=Sphingosinicella sp. CPCC 101087 TaxID=2497754 RepID=UPI00101CA41E|nr:molybdenum cofactor biosynthesis protein MoaE [Sphingosinicella sp. CPCC 101087]
MKVQVRLAAEPFAPDLELADFVGCLATEGAVVSFVGLVRPHSKDGTPLTSLFLDHHPRLTERSLGEIGAAAATEFDVSAIRIVHRCGKMQPGDPIVFAAAAATHRRPAFEAADYLMDRLKTDALFWKREEDDTGSRWIEPTGADHADRARWERASTCPE